ncbi:SCO3374 family protein [Streptomyces dysideae]|uniref:Proline-rich protein n=1 Tax=Streptomyces dysideae TaxID=909626 RepID=A0A101UUY9_9ACTN|nr:SCO3374 family protein [Streptomyces dysideae]KUO17348.1 hypothetical protein AQJ91_31315 [Streptomyces dysideae]
MVGTLPTVTTVPLPRRPVDPDHPSDGIRRWYENELGWPTVPGRPDTPVRLSVGVHYDVLDVPAEAGHAALRHLLPGSPVAVQAGRLRILMAAGSADDLPTVLDWLEWGKLAVDLTAIGEGGTMDAPLPPEPGPGAVVRRPAAPHPDGLTAVGQAAVARYSCAAGQTGGRPLPLGRSGALQGAAVWLRPPEPGCEVEASLPTLSAMGGVGGAPDLVRVLHTVATHCHRLRLRRACARP